MADNSTTSNGKAKSGTGGAKGVRSPNYPVIDLEEAVQRIKMVYDKEHTHPTTRENLAKDMGYGSLNGSSASVISALSKYGLLEAVGDEQYKISSEALDIVLHHRGEPERVQAIQKVGFLPTLFSELRTAYGDNLDRLPSDHTIQAHLIKRGFNPKTVGSAIRAYRDTMAFVNEETKGLSTTEGDRKEESVHTSLGNQGTSRSEGAQGQRDSNTGSRWGMDLEGDPGKVLAFPIAFDTDARVVFRGRITKEAIDTLIAYLEVSKRSYPSEKTFPPAALPFPEHYEKGFDNTPADNDNEED